MGEEIYYKATLSGGVSCNPDGDFTQYRIGLNVHPRPDTKYEGSCGRGLHLAKTFRAAMNYAHKATEFYVCRAGLILGEDKDKVRCSYVWIDRILTPEEVSQLKTEAIEAEARETAEKKRREEISKMGLPSNPLCGQDWLDKHMFDYSISDIAAQRLEIISGNHKITLKNSLKKKDIRTALSAVSGI